MYSKIVPIKQITFTLTLLIADLTSKTIVTNRFAVGDKHAVLPNIFWVELAYNKGFAFGLGGAFSALLMPLYILAVLFITNLLRRKRGMEGLGLSILLAGVLGNTFDRASDGVVTDFLALTHFAIFNLADCFIFLGLIITIISNWEGKEKRGY